MNYQPTSEPPSREFAQSAAIAFLGRIDGQPISAEATVGAAQAWAVLALSLPEERHE